MRAKAVSSPARPVPAPRPGRSRLRLLVVLLAAVAIVVAGSLTWSHLAGRALTGADEAPPNVLMAAGTADTLTAAERSGPDVLPAEGRDEPAKAEWQALLPRLQQAAADPQDRNAQRKLALAYYNLGDLQNAESIYLRLLESEEDAVLRNRLGNTLRDLGDGTGAEQAYRRAISDDPTLSPPYVNLAELLWREGKDREARAIVDQGLRAVPKDKAAALQAAADYLKGAG